METRAGSIILTSSTADAKGYSNVAHCVAAKRGVVGLMRTLANELAPHSIRVNAVLPTNCNTRCATTTPVPPLLARRGAVGDRGLP